VGQSEPEVGSRHVYVGAGSLAEVLSGAPLSAEMRELDMHPNTEVVVEAVVPADETGAHDNSEDAAVVSWRDRSENARQTSVGLGRFAELFEPMG
jgi:hypothetical protein